MTPERWRQVEALYEAALERDASERPGFLENACAGDDALRQKVEELLQAHEVAGNFLDEPALEAAASAMTIPAESLVGAEISHYQVLSLLGKGGMGEVYLARDTRLDRKVALKMLPANLASDTNLMQRFLREAKAASAFNHPNVAAIYDVGERYGTRFIAMEYVEGQTVAARISSGALDPAEVIEIGVQVADALNEAHSKGITHRDIKPANLMLTARGHVKVLDFGLAKITPTEDWIRDTTIKGLTQMGSVMGTVNYMSPEQVLGREVDHRTDIFSFGVVLYEMATGRSPFAGATMGETMDRILHAEPETIAPLDQSELARIVRKCMEKDPDRRYASAHDLWIDLKNLQRHTGFAAILSDREVRPRRRSGLTWPKSKWLGAAAAIAIAAAAIWALLLRQTSPVLPFSPRDWVLVTDVDNQTGDSVFDKSLLTAFVIGLEQSRYANVLPRARATESLKRMKKTGAEPIDEVLGRDIALREGVRALIIPSIASVGETYQIVARIQNPATSQDIRTEQVRANGKDNVLGAVDDLVAKIRTSLGESLTALAQTSKPLADATTASMEALRQYSLANENLRASKFAEAVTYFENALRIDPSFTTAKAQLGILHAEFFDRAEGKLLLSEAIEHVDSLTDREKYGILAFHARVVENDLPKAVQLYKLLLGLYPDDWLVYNNLGWFSYQLGRADDAVAAYKEALRLDPYVMLSYNGFAEVYLYLVGDMDAALDLLRKQISYDDRVWFAYENMGWAYLGKGDPAAAEQSFKKAEELNAMNLQVRVRLGHTYFLQGRHREAADLYRAIFRADPNDFYPLYFAGIACGLAGDLECQRESFAKFIAGVNQRIRSNPNQAWHRLDLAKALARSGRPEESQTAARTAMEMSPNMHFDIAEFLSVQGKTTDAIAQLELAIQNGFRNFVWMKIDPDFQKLQNTPRFRELLKTHLKTGG